MKRITSFSIFVLLTFIIPLTGKSQEAVKGRSNFSVGYGFLPLEIRGDYNGSYSGATSNYSRVFFGPVYIKYEYLFEYNLSLGITYAFATYKFNYTEEHFNYNNYTAYYTHQTETDRSYSILFRMDYHMIEYQEKFRWDPYVGLGFGYRKISYELENSSGSYYTNYHHQDPSIISSGFGMETTIGIRYFLTPHFAFFAEGGFSKSAFQFGSTISF
ncbi:MAG: hypothetical protein JJE25_11500 [Bacteroidia bacterium]|nr:hypothetical protein [Bacteroidia bacterium]